MVFFGVGFFWGGKLIRYWCSVVLLYDRVMMCIWWLGFVDWFLKLCILVVLCGFVDDSLYFFYLWQLID